MALASQICSIQLILDKESDEAELELGCDNEGIEVKVRVELDLNDGADGDDGSTDDGDCEFSIFNEEDGDDGDGNDS